MLDAYYSDALPFHLTTQEFLELVRDRLAPGGIVVANVIGAVEGENSKLFARSTARTARSSRAWPCTPSRFKATPRAIRNIIVVAGEAALPSRDFLTERWAEVTAAHPKVPDLSDAIAAATRSSSRRGTCRC